MSWRPQLILAYCSNSPLDAIEEGEEAPDWTCLWFQPEEIAASKFEARVEAARRRARYCATEEGEPDEQGLIAGILPPVLGGILPPQPDCPEPSAQEPSAQPQEPSAQPQEPSSQFWIGGAASARPTYLHAAALAPSRPASATPYSSNADGKRAFVSEDELRLERAKRQALETGNHSLQMLQLQQRMQQMQQERQRQPPPPPPPPPPPLPPSTSWTSTTTQAAGASTSAAPRPTANNPHGLTMSQRVAALQANFRKNGTNGLWELPYG